MVAISSKLKNKEDMATRKLGRGKGALRRSVTSPPAPGDGGDLASPSHSSESLSGQVMEARVTVITNVTSFWAQLGTGKFFFFMQLGSC